MGKGRGNIQIVCSCRIPGKAGEFSLGRTFRKARKSYRKYVRPGVRALGRSARRSAKRGAFKLYKRL